MTDDLAKEILEQIRHLDRKLTDHMQEEDQEVAAIRKDISEWQLAAEKRHTELIRSLDAWTNKIDCTAAFLTKDGLPDLHGHRDDHHSRKQSADEFRDLAKSTQKVVAGGAAMGALTWLFYTIWEAFLRGPHNH